MAAPVLTCWFGEAVRDFGKGNVLEFEDRVREYRLREELCSA